MSELFKKLRPVKFEQSSWADLIVLAGTVVLEHWTKSPAGHFGFCGGRTDAVEDGGASKYLQPRLTSNSSILQLEDAIELMGLTPTEFVVLNAAGYSLGDTDCIGIFCQRQKKGNNSGDSSGIIKTQNLLAESEMSELGEKKGKANEFFVTLLEETWQSVGDGLFEAEGSPGTYMLGTDLLWREGKLRVISER